MAKLGRIPAGLRSAPRIPEGRKTEHYATRGIAQSCNRKNQVAIKRERMVITFWRASLE